MGTLYKFTWCYGNLSKDEKIISSVQTLSMFQRDLLIKGRQGLMNKKSLINQSGLKMLDRIKEIDDRDDRVALMFEVYEWVFNEVVIDDELFVPDWGLLNEVES